MKKNKESYCGAGCGPPSSRGLGTTVAERCGVQGISLNSRIAYFNPALG